jgi:hypothetical protein
MYIYISATRTHPCALSTKHQLFILVAIFPLPPHTRQYTSSMFGSHCIRVCLGLLEGYLLETDHEGCRALVHRIGLLYESAVSVAFGQPTRCLCVYFPFYHLFKDSGWMETCRTALALQQLLLFWHNRSSLHNSFLARPLLCETLALSVLANGSNESSKLRFPGRPCCKRISLPPVSCLLKVRESDNG